MVAQFRFYIISFFLGYSNLEVINVDPKTKRLVIDGDADKPIPEDIYPVIDTDLARDNVENDLSPADL